MSKFSIVIAGESLAESIVDDAAAAAEDIAGYLHSLGHKIELAIVEHGEKKTIIPVPKAEAPAPEPEAAPAETDAPAPSTDASTETPAPADASSEASTQAAS
ncbi:MAG: hypothetical protein PW734_06750 [Verrucomicrobium sp.]|nr:hypothetical protein [Verrucomicrobium sp.]